MTERGAKLLAQALHLTAEERAELAVELVASVDGQPDADAEAVWATEIERRARRALAGETIGADWDTVRSRLEQHLGE